MKRLLALVFLVLSVSNVNAQVNYFVSQTGSDSADGLSPATAFRSLAKASSLPLSAGDRILLERGSIWRGEQLVLDHVAGTAANPVVIGSYGSGAKPTIYGSIPVDSAGWSPVAGSPGVFTRNVSGQTNALFAGTDFLVQQPSLAQVKSTPGSWVRSGNNVYVNAGGTPLDNLNVSVGVVDRNVWIRNSQNVVVEDLIVRDSANGLDGESFKFDTSRDMVMRNLEAHNASFHHFEVIDTDNFLGENLIATVAEPGKGGSAFVSYSGIDSVSGHDDHVWRNISYSDPKAYGLFVTHGNTMGDVLIENAFADGPNRMGIQTEGSNQSVVVRGGQVGGIGLFGDGVLIDGVRVTGKGAIVEVSGDNNTIQNVLMEVSQFDPIKNTAMFVLGQDNVIRFNTLIMDPATVGERGGFYLSPTGSADFYGNVLKNFPLNIRIDGEAGFVGLNAYNGGLFRRFAGTPLDLNGWNSLGFDAGSVMSNLNFLDPLTGDFRLAMGQPAIDLIPGDFALRPELDFSRVTIPATGAIDPGAFQLLVPHTVAVPEASTLILVGLGMMLVIGCRIRCFGRST